MEMEILDRTYKELGNDQRPLDDIIVIFLGD